MISHNNAMKLVSGNNNNNKCYTETTLTFVLFCKGRGSDQSCYRPNLDETQWVGRKDALCRCVTAALYGTLESSSSSLSRKVEVILLHDEDLSLMRMARCNSSYSQSNHYSLDDDTTESRDFKREGRRRIRRGYQGTDSLARASRKTLELPTVPTEHNLISLWKRATAVSIPFTFAADRDVLKLSRQIHPPEATNLATLCWCERETWCGEYLNACRTGEVVACSGIHRKNCSEGESFCSDDDENDGSFLRWDASHVAGRNKRDLLTELLSFVDASCQNNEGIKMAYLRKWKLNSSVDAVLRKTSKEKLILAQQEWNDSVRASQFRDDGHERGAEVDKDKCRGRAKEWGKSGRNRGRMERTASPERRRGSSVEVKEKSSDTNDSDKADHCADKRLVYTLSHILRPLAKDKETGKAVSFVRSPSELPEEGQLEGAALPKERNSNDVESHTQDLVPTTIAVYLHELCRHELPCFGTFQETKNGSASRQRPENMVVFLGAVRDMCSEEFVALQSACDATGVPLLGCNLGNVVEFSSKVIAAITFHYCRDVLGKAIATMWRDGTSAAVMGRQRESCLGIAPILNSYRRKERINQELLKHDTAKRKEEDKSATVRRKVRDSLRTAKSATVMLMEGKERMLPGINDYNQEGTTQVPNQPTTPSVVSELVVLCLVPMHSTDLSAKLFRRCPLTWEIVRVCVTTLWRSRLASSSSSLPSSVVPMSMGKSGEPSNTSLVLIFEDGLILTLSQEDFVSRLAARHWAAPTEHQILVVLCELRNASSVTSMPQPDNTSEFDWDRVLSNVVRDRLQRSSRSSRNKRSSPMQQKKLSSVAAIDTFVIDDQVHTSDINFGGGGGRAKKSAGDSTPLLDAIYSEACRCREQRTRKQSTHFSKDACIAGNGKLGEPWLVFVVVGLGGVRFSSGKSEGKLQRTKLVHCCMLRALRTAGVPTVAESMTQYGHNKGDVTDAAGVIVTMLQHFNYHHRLTDSLEILIEQNIVRKNECCEDVGNDTPLPANNLCEERGVEKRRASTESKKHRKRKKR